MDENKLKRIVVDFHWMARRYCDGRQTYATSVFNQNTRDLIAMGVRPNAIGDGTPWARDGGGRSYDLLTDEEAALGQPPDYLHGDLERRAEAAEAEVARLRADKAELLAELSVIANAKPSKWDIDTRDEFQAWAQNRARAALAKHGGDAHAE